MTMKKMISLALATCMALALAVSVGAAGTEDMVVSEEQYQKYEEIAQQVSEETGVGVVPCPREEMNKVYTEEEYRESMVDFCKVIEAIEQPDVTTSSVQAFNNPSAGGNGTKIMTVNMPKNYDGGYFLWTIYGRAVIAGGGPYHYDSSAGIAGTGTTIDEIKLVTRPSSNYTSTNYGGVTKVSSTNTVRILEQKISLKKLGVAVTDTPISMKARFTLDTSTGKVTLTTAS